jgi:hypothetical protein
MRTPVAVRFTRRLCASLDMEFVLLSPVLLLLSALCLNTLHWAEDYVRAAVWLLVRG